ncbi:MAG: hypothetical protein V9E84_05550, partial [Trichococcus flocculiformis]
MAAHAIAEPNAAEPNATATASAPGAGESSADVTAQPVVPDASVNEDPQQVVAEVSPGEPAKISVAKVDEAGKLVVTTTPVIGPEQAANAVADAQQAPATVAVGVAAPVRISALPAVEATSAMDPGRWWQWALNDLR